MSGSSTDSRHPNPLHIYADYDKTMTTRKMLCGITGVYMGNRLSLKSYFDTLYPYKYCEQCIENISPLQELAHIAL